MFSSGGVSRLQWPPLTCNNLASCSLGAAVEGAAHVECRGEAARTEPPRRDGHDLVSGHPLGHRRRGPDDRPRGPRHLHEPRGRVAHRMGRRPRPTAGRLEDVFRIVNEETRKAVEQPVRKVIETGLVRGMANHTLLIARDGTERPIDDSAAPVRDEAGTLIGVVMVFRDISEQRRRERDGPGRHSPTPRASSTPSASRSSSSMPTSASGRRAARSTRPSGSAPEETEGRLVYELGDGQWDIPAAPDAPRRNPPQGQLVPRLRGGRTTSRASAGGGCSSTAARSVGPANHSELILLAIEDVTERWRAGVAFRRQPRAIPGHRRGGHGLRHLHVRHRRASITSWNAGAEKMLGYSEAEILGAGLPHHLHARGPRGPPGGPGDADRGGRGPSPR